MAAGEGRMGVGPVKLQGSVEDSGAAEAAGTEQVGVEPVKAGPAIETVNLTKRYDNVTAVDKLNLKVMPGTIFGLLGPNGAGKTTTILMLLGLTEPTEGRAIVGGYDAARHPLLVKSMVGYLPDNVGFYDELSGWENLSYTAALNGLKSEQAEERIAMALERVGLAEEGKRKVGEYSRGMRQRLGIADVLVKDPQLLILDEPTLGIDPEGAQDLLNLIADLARRDGRTVLLSSHLLHQVQQVCDRVGIFVDGKLIACGTIDELETQLMGDTILLELAAVPFDEALVRFCREIDGVKGVEKQAGLLVLHCTKDIRSCLAKRLLDKGYDLQHLRLKGFSLDDIYRRYFQGGMVS